MAFILAGLVLTIIIFSGFILGLFIAKACEQSRIQSMREIDREWGMDSLV